jgi:beta-1,4-mannosyl-glycoprotein beta-1,4-N-acetylglucosaminyltransferase
MIIDCFNFLDEYDLLEGRLKYLWDVVDHFVIIEGNTTFQGNHKEYYFKKAAESGKFFEYRKKIIWCPVDNTTLNLDFSVKVEGYSKNSPVAKLERHQRDAALHILRKFGMEDLVMTGDLDEVPHKHTVQLVNDYFKRNIYNIDFCIAPRQICFYYNFNQCMTRPWAGTVIASNYHTISNTPQNLRDKRFETPGTLGGWHLSYFMSSEKIKEKLESFVHQEYNKEYFKNLGYINGKIKAGEDFLEKDKFIPFDINTLPRDMVECFKSSVNIGV